MSPKVKRRFHAIIRRTGIKPKRALEVGGLMGEDSLLRFPELAGAERYCLNLVDLPSEDGIAPIKGNANDMRQFEDGMFDLVVCCSTLEHDKRFWLSLAEMKRVLAPGGLLVIGAGLRQGRGARPGPLDAHLPRALRVRLLPLQRAGRPRGLLRRDGAGPRAGGDDAAADHRPRPQAAPPPAARAPPDAARPRRA